MSDAAGFPAKGAQTEQASPDDRRRRRFRHLKPAPCAMLVTIELPSTVIEVSVSKNASMFSPSVPGGFTKVIGSMARTTVSLTEREDQL
jgi:hypothetical protein